MLTRRLPLITVAVMVSLMAFGAQALARRGVSGVQKRRILTAAGVSTHAPAACFRVYVSSVAASWAATTYGGSNSRPCITYGANGVSITHFVRGRWRFVIAGSAFNCPIPGHIPVRVQRDLRLSCH